jgi:hypothetical protein
MNEREVILLILTLISLVLSVIVYNKMGENSDRHTKKYLSSVKYSDSPIIQLLTMFNSYFQVNLNNINATINPNINPIIVPSSITPAGIQAFFMKAYAGNITVTIQSASPIKFSRYYENNGLLFITDVNCTLNMGYLNFTGIQVMGHNLPDINFQNISMPFNLTVKLLLNTKDYNETVVSLKLDNTSTIYFPDNVKQSFADYWSRIYLDYNTDDAMIAVLTIIRKEFWDQLNSIANLLEQINNHLPAIEDSFNCELVANNQKPNALFPLAAQSQNNCSNSKNTDFINICNQNSAIIDIVSQINLNPWDFSTILCDSDQCKTNAINNYFIISTDYPFQNFSTSQLYITTSDFGTCYAINMEKSSIDLFPQVFSQQNVTNGKFNNPLNLLRTSQANGTIIIIPNVRGYWYLSNSDPKMNFLNITIDKQCQIALYQNGQVGIGMQGIYNFYNQTLTFPSYSGLGQNTIVGTFNIDYDLTSDTITLGNLGTFHR